MWLDLVTWRASTQKHRAEVMGSHFWGVGVRGTDFHIAHMVFQTLLPYSYCQSTAVLWGIPWWGPYGKELRSASGQQPARDWGPPPMRNWMPTNIRMSLGNRSFYNRVLRWLQSRGAPWLPPCEKLWARGQCPGFLTCRNYDIINIYCLKTLVLSYW